MRVLITGGAGFIGSHLVESLIASGEQVTVLDDLSTGRLANLEALEGQAGFRFERGSAADARLVGDVAREADCIVHLAAAVGVRLIVEHPVRTIETNVTATEVVLDAASRQETPVLLASTSEVYGKSAKVPFREDDDLNLGPTVHSRWAYACSKALDEWLGFAYMQEKGVPVSVARLFNTVGPRQVGDYGMVLPNFVQQALQDAPITVFGDGSQTRCFVAVSDAVAALRLIMAHPDAAGEVFNVGTEREITILELAHMVRDRTGSSSRISIIPYEEAYATGFEDMPRRVPDVSKLQARTGFKANISLETIIDDVAEGLRREGQPQRSN